MNLPVMVPGRAREHLLAWCRAIDAGPYSTLAAGERITFRRYLNFLGRGAEGVIAQVPTTTAGALRDALRRMADLGADETLLVPTTLDVTELERVADVCAGLTQRC